ncbi:hypothetical protein ACB098_11G017200 [Castanea mollissima]
MINYRSHGFYIFGGILSSWNDSVHFCNWHGITCGCRHQRVTTLELQGHNLRGTIPPYIGNLTFLKAINLRNNSFYGEIPMEVGQLFRLQELSLTNNTLGGEIPTNLSNCSELRLINAPEKQTCWENSHGAWLFDQAYFSSEGNIPESVGRSKSFLDFSVESNKLNGTVPSSLYNISSIRVLSFTRNQLSGTLPKNKGHTIPNLQWFTISSNKFCGSIPSSLCNASKLQFLELSCNSFVGSVPTNLGYLRDLEFLNLQENKLGRDLDFLTSLRNCSKMNGLSFAANRFEGVLPSSIGNLSTRLTGLYVGGNKISGTIPVALQNLINLIILSMENNLFTGMIPTYFGKFQKMQGLDLSKNNLSGKIPSSIGNLTQLAELFLSQYNLEGSIPPSIGTCQSLQKLDVSENYLSGVIPQQVLQIFSLSLLLNLSHNSFSGKLPVEVDSLKNINLLDVSENKLSSLEHLDVSQNNLSGLIPKGLEKLSFLTYLNISFNNIEGEVPTEGVFGNVNIISIIGNNKLCGGIPQLQLPICHKVTKSRKSLASRLTITIVCVVTSTNGFSFNNLIGSGSFGVVYKGVLEQDERLVAVKVLNLQNKDASKSFMAICKSLVFEFMTNGSLEVWLHPMIDSSNQSKNLSVLQRLIIAIDVAFALNYLHNHCDNILLDSDMIAHVSDFGLSRLLTTLNDSSQKCTSTIGLKGSIGYAASEYGMGGEASTEGDVYSYGVLVLEMFTGRRLTDDMFKDGLNLHNFVKMSLPKRLIKVVDPMLLPREVEEMGVATVAMMATKEDDNDNDNEIEEEEANNTEDFRHIDVDMQKGLL